MIDSILAACIISPLAAALFRSRASADLSMSGDPGQMWSALSAGLWDPASRASYVLTAIAVIVFWIYKSATPGKMIFGAKIVDADTGGALTTGQAIGRYFAYYVSLLPLCLGFLWVAFDARKQGFHDKLAGTVVVRKRRSAAAVDFKGPPPPVNRG
jgi:uncharacterized RDD family membrane protein YckC